MLLSVSVVYDFPVFLKKYLTVLLLGYSIGKPYFVSTNNNTLYAILEQSFQVAVDFVSSEETNLITLYTNDSTIINYKKRITTDVRLADTVYGQKISVKGFNLYLILELNDTSDFRSYFINVTNSMGVAQYTITVNPAGKIS